MDVENTEVGTMGSHGDRRSDGGGRGGGSDSEDDSSLSSDSSSSSVGGFVSTIKAHVHSRGRDSSQTSVTRRVSTSIFDALSEDAQCDELILAGDLVGFRSWLRSKKKVVFTKLPISAHCGLDDFLRELLTTSLVTEVEFRDVDLSWYVALELLAVLEANTFIKSLTMNSVRMSAFPPAAYKEAKSLVATTSSVTELVFNNCSGFTQFADLMVVMLATGGRDSITTLILNKCGVGERECQAIASSLVDNDTLRVLSLTNNRIFFATTIHSLQAAVTAHRFLKTSSLASIIDGDSNGWTTRWTLLLYLVYTFLGPVYQLMGIFACSVRGGGILSRAPVNFSDVMYVDPSDKALFRQVLARALIGYSAMILVPLLCFFFYSSRGSYAGDVVFFSIYVVLLLFVMSLITWTAARDRAKSFLAVENPSTHVRLNSHNIRRIAGMVGSFFQIYTIANFSGEWDYLKAVDIVNHEMEAPERFMQLFFFGLLLLWWFISLYIGTNLVRGQVVGPLLNVPFLNVTMQFLGSFMFVSLCGACIRSVQCNHSVKPSVWILDPRHECGSIDHAVWASVITLALVMYILSASVIGLQFIEDHSPLNDVRIVEIYSLGERIFKFLVISAYYFLHAHRWVVLVILFIYGLIYGIISYNYQPCKDITWVNNFRVVHYGFLAFAAAVDMTPWLFRPSTGIYKAMSLVSMFPSVIALVVFSMIQLGAWCFPSGTPVYDVESEGSGGEGGQTNRKGEVTPALYGKRSVFLHELLDSSDGQAALVGETASRVDSEAAASVLRRYQARRTARTAGTEPVPE